LHWTVGQLEESPVFTPLGMQSNQQARTPGA